ncbi:MAG: MarR family winged helix-turn-helix transcriptional regulator [Fastidiosipilaceae bacterium]|jgi:DNA-binding MarR family transcriptional regulator
MKKNADEILELLLNIYDKIERTQDEALLKGYFSDITRTEMNTLDRIGPYDTRTMGETAGRLGITTGTLTVAVDRLVKKGYVERKRAETDRRIVLLSLTRKGKLAYRMYRKFHRRMVEDIFASMDEMEEKQLVNSFEGINEYLNEQYQMLKGKDKRHAD